VSAYAGPVPIPIDIDVAPEVGIPIPMPMPIPMDMPGTDPVTTMPVLPAAMVGAVDAEVTPVTTYEAVGGIEGAGGSLVPIATPVIDRGPEPFGAEYAAAPPSAVADTPGALCCIWATACCATMLLEPAVSLLSTSATESLTTARGGAEARDLDRRSRLRLPRS